MKGMPPRIGFRPSNTDFLLTKSCSWNWNRDSGFREEGGLKPPYYPKRALKFRLQNVWGDICRVGGWTRQSGVSGSRDCMRQTHNFASQPTARTVLRGLYAYLNDRPAAPLYSFMPTCRSGREGETPQNVPERCPDLYLIVHPPGDDGGPVQVDGAGGVVAPVHGHHRYRGCHLCNSAFSADCFYYARPRRHLVARHHTALPRRKVGGKTVPTVSTFHINLENIYAKWG